MFFMPSISMKLIPIVKSPTVKCGPQLSKKSTKAYLQFSVNGWSLKSFLKHVYQNYSIKKSMPTVGPMFMPT